MINWKEIKGLHVIKKLEEIIARWYQVEVFFTDEHGRIQGSFFENQDIEFDNPFLNLQVKTTYGKNYIKEDMAKVIEVLQNSSEKSLIYDSYFPGVKGMAAKVIYNNEFSGTVFVYPFVKDNITKSDLDKIGKTLIENGASKDDSEAAVESLGRLFPRQIEKLREMLEFETDEILTFHEEIQKREDRIQLLNSEIGNKYRYHSLIGKSKSMQDIYRLLEKVSGSDSTILIQGENGTGKELVAKAIHYNGPRKNNVFLAVNCSAFNDNLLDSELFGHVKGAFTGAVRDKKGLFEQANGGTLFLDEIGDTSLTMQVKLLRVLQEGTFLPVGETRPRKVNVRIIAATNRPLKQMIKNSEFREDFYYRINVINVQLPTLKERSEDIPLLVDHFLEKRCAESGIPTKVLSKKSMEKLLDYSFPGNVRELQNEIERMVVLAQDVKVVTPDYLSPKILEESELSGHSRGVNTSGQLKDALEELEYIMIKDGLKRCNFNKSKLAKELGISRAGLILKVEKYGLDKRKKASGE